MPVAGISPVTSWPRIKPAGAAVAGYPSAYNIHLWDKGSPRTTFSKSTLRIFSPAVQENENKHFPSPISDADASIRIDYASSSCPDSTPYAKERLFSLFDRVIMEKHDFPVVRVGPLD